MLEAGRWRLYARWPSNSNRVRDATYQIHHANGMTAVQVEQRGSGGMWVPRAARRANPMKARPLRFKNSHLYNITL